MCCVANCFMLSTKPSCSRLPPCSSFITRPSHLAASFSMPQVEFHHQRSSAVLWHACALGFLWLSFWLLHRKVKFLAHGKWPWNSVATSACGEAGFPPQCWSGNSMLTPRLSSAFPSCAAGNGPASTRSAFERTRGLRAPIYKASKKGEREGVREFEGVGGNKCLCQRRRAWQ